MKKILVIIMVATVAQVVSSQHNIPTPTPAQLKWQEAELAALLSYDLHVFDGKEYVQQENRITPVAEYNIFNPQNYDMDQWVKSLKDAGFRIAIFTVSHETGFFFHQSNATPFCMKALRWQDGKGDLLRDFKASCEKYGILPESISEYAGIPFTGSTISGSMVTMLLR